MSRRPSKADKPNQKSRLKSQHILEKRGAEVAVPPLFPIESTLAFYLDDFARTLFPLKTNREIIQRGEREVVDYIQKCLDESDKEHHFTVQRRVYGAKPNQHLRRTVKLDAVSEYYIYDVIFRNRHLFRKPHTSGRTHYGYRFEGGEPIPPTAAYKAFKGALAEYSAKYSESMSFDVASYFNGVYHHDIVSWFSELGASNDDAEGLGQLLREINSGRSVDCLPQGLYPTKMIGNDFLRFIDNHHGLKSNQLVRFMDDVYLFSDSPQDIAGDFQLVQRLLGDKGLSVNPQKTVPGSSIHVDMDNEIDTVKRALLARRRHLVTEGYDEKGEEIVKAVMMEFPLSKEELKYIDSLLEKPDLEEDDAELVLTIMRDHVGRVEKRLPYILRRYPHLTKNVHGFCASIENKDFIANLIIDHVKDNDRIMEFQLFWFAAILEDHVMGTMFASQVIDMLFNHPSSTSITRAKILEMDDRRFGLTELRSEYLNSGQSDWLAWSSAVGSRSLKPLTRNHRLKYFGNSSPMNHLIASIMLKT